MTHKELFDGKSIRLFLFFVMAVKMARMEKNSPNRRKLTATVKNGFKLGTNIVTDPENIPKDREKLAEAPKCTLKAFKKRRKKNVKALKKFQKFQKNSKNPKI